MGTRYLAADCRKRAAQSEGEDISKRVKNPVDKRTLFVKQLLHEFGKHCDDDIMKKEPRMRLYPGISQHGGQTSTCSKIALENFNQTKGEFYCLDVKQPMDSTGFEIMARDGNSSQATWYVHVNFWAQSSRGQRVLFFAELRGVEEPNETLVVLPFGHDSETIKAMSGEHLCNFCTGILHPRFRTFKGARMDQLETMS